MTEKIIQFFSCGQICDLHKMAEIEREAAELPVICNLEAREFM